MNNKIAVVVGLGSNDIEIPLLVFPDVTAASNQLTNLGLELKTHPNSGKPFCRLPEEKMERQKDDKGSETNPILLTLFKKYPNSNSVKYYDGCGGCYDLRIDEIEFGQPFIGWDLD